MALIKCNQCNNKTSNLSKVCANCGTSIEVSDSKEVSQLYTFLFGGFYFFFKGWYKAGIAAIVLTFITGLIAIFILPFIAKKFVEAFEK